VLRSPGCGGISSVGGEDPAFDLDNARRVRGIDLV
jgi:hypothetical protein